MAGLEGNPEANGPKSNIPEVLRNGSDQANAPKTPYERLAEAYVELSYAYREFVMVRDRETIDNRPFFDDFNAGTFRDPKTVGFKGTQARIVYGDWSGIGNIQGSFYVLYGENILRIRFAGNQYIELMTPSSYLYIYTANDNLKLSGLNGKPIDRINEGGVVLKRYETEAEMEEIRDYRIKKRKYKDEVIRRSTLKSKLFAAASRVLGNSEEELIEPLEPMIDLESIMPHDELTELLVNVTEGLKLAVSTIEEFEKQKEKTEEKHLALN